MNIFLYVIGLIFINPSIFCVQKKARDPFFLTRITEKTDKKKEPFYIVGMVQHNQSKGLLVQDGDKQRTMVVGDEIQGYTLSLITRNYAEFSKKNKTKRIEIR